MKLFYSTDNSSTQLKHKSSIDMKDQYTVLKEYEHR